MVATDTVVGIIGAVVLVAVMAGVFVYEYNNTDAEGSSMHAQEHFEEDFAGLAATQDMDGDGTPNYQDEDIDGDGTPNADDTELTQTVTVSGSVPAPSPTGAGSPYTQGFSVQNGSVHFQGSLTYARTGGVTPNMQATLTGPDGFSVTATSTSTQTSGTLTFDVAEGLAPGDYTLSIRQTGANGLVPVGQAASVTGTLEVHYATPADGGEHDDH